VAATRSDVAREARVRRGSVVLVLAGLAAVCGLALVVNVPVATWALAGLLAGLAALRLLPSAAAVLGARSRAFDVTLLLVMAVALALLAPAGLLD